MVLKILAIILGVVLVFTIGYLVINSVINLFNGYTFADAFHASWYDITHLWGLVKNAAEETADQVFPMANSAITWNTARSW